MKNELLETGHIAVGERNGRMEDVGEMYKGYRISVK